MNYQMLPGVNACLNAGSAVLLAAGYWMIRKGRVAAHRACMLSAFVLSVIFLVLYVVHHAHAGIVHFTGRGVARAAYLAILSTHTVLAVVNVPLVLRAFYLALQERFAEHKRIARWAWPVWMYVSVTGVVVYFMLYRLGTQ